jgi:hypothetical protein
MQHPQVALAMCNLIRAVGEELFASHIPQRFPEPRSASSWRALLHPTFVCPGDCRTFDSMGQLLLPLLIRAGASVFRDPILMAEVMEVLRVLVQQADAENAALRDLLPAVEEAITASLFPAVMLMQGNAPMLELLWNVVSQLPIDMRYRIYARGPADVASENPLMAHLRTLTQRQLKRILRRLSQDTQKECSRKVARLANRDPQLVFEEVRCHTRTHTRSHTHAHTHSLTHSITH